MTAGYCGELTVGGRRCRLLAWMGLRSSPQETGFEIVSGMVSYRSAGIRGVGERLPSGSPPGS
jgi:hypothetical protein